MKTPLFIQGSDEKDFIIRAGICQAVVCTSMTDKVAVATKLNTQSPTGTSHRWTLAKRGRGKKNPEPCAEVKGNFHYLFEC